MEDFESIALGLKLPAAKAARGVNDHIVFSNADTQLLSQLPNSALYNVLLRLMEGELEKLETLHLQSWAEKDKFERTGLIAVAARVFYEGVQKEVNYQSAEAVSAREAEEIDRKVADMTPEEILRSGFGME